MAKKIIVWIILVIVLATTIFLLINNIDKSEPLYVAHRGYSSKYPGNTALAFEKAAEMPFYGIETDIRETVDGVFVCNHDRDVEFYDGTKRPVNGSKYSELMAKPLKNTVTSDEIYICKFDEYLDICKNGGKIAVIELKDDSFNDEQIVRIFQIIDEHYDRDHCIFIAFDFESLCRVHNYDGNVGVQYLSSKLNDKNFDKCLELGISIDVHFTICTASLVRKFHKKGLTVQVWTVDNKILRNMLRRLKVDLITSNELYEN